MLSTLSINALELLTTIGVHAWEQKIQQKILLDLDISVDITQAAQEDDIQYALDYSALSQLLIDYAAETKHQLIESLAYQLQELIIKHFPQIKALSLTVQKPGAIPKAKATGICLRWG